MHGVYHIGIAYAKVCRWSRAAALAVLLAVIMSACGAYTKADFTARANAICASTVRQLRALAPPRLSGASVERSLAAYLQRALPILASEADQLRGLRRPGGSTQARAELDRYLRALAANLAQYRRLAAASAAGDRRAVAGAETALVASDIDALADRYGILSCGAPQATSG